MSESLHILEITTVTLVGVGRGKPGEPIERGNCFSIIASDKNHYGVVNFSHENYEEIVDKQLKLSDVKIRVLCKGTAIIHDHRIPHEWYDNRFCEVCCPEDHLPITQKLQIERELESGARVRTTFPDGLVMDSFKVKGSMRPLKGRYTLESAVCLKNNNTDIDPTQEIIKALR